MKKRLGTTFATVLFLGVASLSSLSAQADSDWNRGRAHHHGQGYGEEQRYDRRYDYNGWNNRYYPPQRERVVYYTPGYYAPRYQMIYYSPWEPAPAVTVYRVGTYLPRGAHCVEPPRNVVAMLPPVEVGTRYVQVDRDVYLVSEASKKILDAVVLLSGTR